MELPKSVRVGHLTMAVLAMTTDEQEEIGEGVCNVRQETIKINKTQTLNNQFEVLLHEIGHAVNELAGVSDSTTEESAVLRTTPIWMTVWRDNPDLLDLLCEFCHG